ncbi:putative prolyl 4-hydroxylase 12 isoform X1 [Gossypium australe]|uniref:procollagen-proline 4-dioxygenase n=1 Tax=Gossypium australe TaxID=47621 RepID=A0A5B6UDH2_9ROSI|nr:putative prolyl 4-hydroxylase 12 isoform X1 [Gossypium australe]
MASLVSIFLLLFTCSFSNFSAESRKELKDKEDIHLRHLVQSNVIDPSRVMQLSWRPRVFQYSGFLTDEECDLLISLGHGAKEGILGINDDRAIVETRRQLASSETLLNTNDTVLAMIEERISAWTFLPKENSKPLYVQHYGLEETEQNLDYFGNKSTWALSEPLMATVILYLSNVTKGGEILFPDSESMSETWSDCTKTSNIQKPVKGNAVLFFTTHLNGSPDSSSSHARCPVLEGEMWCAMKFFYLRAVTGEMISFDSSRNECSDEDPSCPEWAAVGECQRNPVFMVGSPDYYGTCRKSCNAC